MDWGYNQPGCMLWVVHLLDGHYHVARELKFHGRSAEDVAEEITRITTHELGVRLSYIAADPSMFNKTGLGTMWRGESMGEVLKRARLPMRPSDRDRFNGWLRVHELLREAPDGTPWLTVEPTCRYLLRTIPAATQDKNDPDDVDTTIDDHGLDALRYWAMSRPAPSRVTKTRETTPWSLGWFRGLEQAPAGPLALRER
jgi:hypothetical protein